MKNPKNSRGRSFDLGRNAVLEAMSDAELKAVAGAGTSKAKSSGGDLPKESISLNYSTIRWSY
ncbi:MAG TPA: hypothetical protein VMG32_03120 [Anaeromyxobacteraceae bacterium]|nr:hypothetical protein [Anaeromyxobacteraceae bacterium]